MKTFFTKAFIALFVCLSLGITSSNAQDSTTWFVNPILIQQFVDVDENNPLKLRMDPIVHNFNPNRFGAANNTLVPTMAYNDVNNPWLHTVLGPTIRWHYNDSIDFSVTNNLPVFTTTHWHGAHVPADADGGPHQIINPGQNWSRRIQVKDESASLWYHPHGMDVTYDHVQMGLSGLLIMDDPTGDDIVTPLDSILHNLHDSLPSTYGTNDFPLIFQTKKFEYNHDSSIVTIKHRFDPACGEGGYKDDFTYLVNGRVDPFIQVPPSLVRFRVLNGDAKFSFNLGIGDRTTMTPEGFYLIATDAGYTDKTYEMDEVLISPGERTEWLVDFSNFNHGDTIFIYNKVSDIPAHVIGSSSTTVTNNYPNGFIQNRALLKIIVNQFFGIGPGTLTLPRDLRPLEPLATAQVSKTREKVFRKDNFTLDSCNTTVQKNYNLYNIDSMLMDMMVVNDVVKMDSTERWTIHNITPISHPFHIHDIHFYVEKIEDTNTGITYTRASDTLHHIFNGPKDNVLIEPGWKLSFIATFDDFGTDIQPQNSYMYHCHILPHEDRGMMGQFVVWDESLPPYPTSTEEPELAELDMRVFPNPTTDVLYLEGSSMSNSTVRFMDVQGRVIREQSLAPFDGTTQLNAMNLPVGMLFIQWITEEGQATKKVIIH